MEKKLGLSALTALVLSSMLGAGVFSLPQNMAAVASPSALIIGWGITGVGILLLGFFLNSRVFLDGQLDVVHLFPGDTVVLALGRNGAAAHGPGGGHETQRQYEGKHHGHRPFEGMRVFHMRTLSFSGLYR